MVEKQVVIVGAGIVGISTAYFLARAGVPVMPVAIKTDFQGNGKLIKDMGPVDPSKTLYFKFGEPMAVEGKGREAHQYVVEFSLLSTGRP